MQQAFRCGWVARAQSLQQGTRESVEAEVDAAVVATDGGSREGARGRRWGWGINCGPSAALVGAGALLPATRFNSQLVRAAKPRLARTTGQVRKAGSTRATGKPKSMMSSGRAAERWDAKGRSGGLSLQLCGHPTAPLRPGRSAARPEDIIPDGRGGPRVPHLHRGPRELRRPDGLRVGPRRRPQRVGPREGSCRRREVHGMGGDRHWAERSQRIERGCSRCSSCPRPRGVGLCSSWARGSCTAS